MNPEMQKFTRDLAMVYDYIHSWHMKNVAGLFAAGCPVLSNEERLPDRGLLSIIPYPRLDDAMLQLTQLCFSQDDSSIEVEKPIILPALEEDPEEETSAAEQPEIVADRTEPDCSVLSEVPVLATLHPNLAVLEVKSMAGNNQAAHNTQDVQEAVAQWENTGPLNYEEEVSRPQQSLSRTENISAESVEQSNVSPSTSLPINWTDLIPERDPPQKSTLKGNVRKRGLSYSEPGTLQMGTIQSPTNTDNTAVPSTRRRGRPVGWKKAKPTNQQNAPAGDILSRPIRACRFKRHKLSWE
uniref:Uncharacterized protein n=1 Tax=Anopheles maculatus TaxID=74869 RepID=A0A182T3E0_9DIPT